jgi:hypothetical protein
LERANAQRAAVTAIKDAGGNLLYDYEIGVPSDAGNTAAVLSRWCRQCFGDDLVSNVAYVRLSGPDQVSPQFSKAVASLATLVDVRQISLRGGGVNDAEMAKLRSLDALESVYLDHTNVTDAGMNSLRYPGKLNELIIVGSPIFGVGERSVILDRWLLPHLNELRSLRSLGLGSMGVTDRDLGRLGALGSLRDLDLHLNPITDAGIADLKLLTNLESLSLDRTLVSDRGLGHLRALKKLTRLRLGSDGITDASVATLREMAGLRYLSVTYCKFSEEGYDRLKSAVPNCVTFHKFFDFAPPHAGKTNDQRSKGTKGAGAHTGQNGKGCAALTE